MARMPVLYDQECRLCRGAARVLRRLDRKGLLAPIGFDEARAHGLATELTDAQLRSSFHVVDLGGATRSGSAALPYVFERLPGGRVPARLLRSSPTLQRAASAAYRFVNRNRGRFTRGCNC